MEDNHLARTPEYLQILHGLASLERERSHLSVAYSYYEEALKLSKELNGGNDQETINLMRQTGQLLERQTQYVDANKLYIEAVRIAHEVLPDKHPDLIKTDLAYGMNLYSLGQTDEALKVVAKVLTDQQAVFRNDNAVLVTTYSDLSRVQLRKGQLDAAEASARNSLRIAMNKSQNTGASCKIISNKRAQA